MAVVVIDVLVQDQPQVPFAGDQQPVQALAAGTGNPVPLEYSIEQLTCAVASRLDAGMVG